MKTVSLNLAKELKGNGYPQEESGFYYNCMDEYYGYSKDEYALVYHKHISISNHSGTSTYAAPTADEILDRLKGRIICAYDTRFQEWYCKRMTTDNFKSTDKDSLADAAAKMYLYLNKKGLLTPPDLDVGEGRE